MKKIAIVGICILIAVILLCPVRSEYKDGGTVVYKALLYQVSDVHSLTGLEEQENGKAFNEGIIIEILGIEVFNNVK